MARRDQAPRKTIHQHVLAPSPRVNPKDTSPEVQPIERSTRSYTTTNCSTHKGPITTGPQGQAFPSRSKIFTEVPTSPPVHSCYRLNHAGTQRWHRRDPIIPSTKKLSQISKNLGRTLLQWTRTSMPRDWNRRQRPQETTGSRNWNFQSHSIWRCTCK